jgi:DNA-binding transcriptional MerR regulator
VSTQNSGFSFQKWYEDNAESLNKTRRERYKTDPEYRDRVLALNKAAREKRRAAKEVEKKRETEAVRVRSGTRPWRQVDGPDAVKMFTIGALARAVGKSVKMIRLWEKNGTIPETPHRSEKGDRLYTLEQIQQIHASLKKQGKVDDSVVRSHPETRSYERRVEFEDGTSAVLKMFRVGVLAQAVDRMVVTVEQMEQRGILPETPFRYSGTRYRLYTAGMIEVVRKALEKHPNGVKAEDAEAFHAEVIDGWRKLNVIGAKVVPDVQVPDDEEESDGAEGSESSSDPGLPEGG